MSYFKDYLPQELKLYIISYINPNEINNDELHSCITTIENLKKYDHTLINVSHLDNLIRVNELYKKYNVYNPLYKGRSNFFYLELTYDPPQLLDALFAGSILPFANSSVKYYNETVEKDINDIVKLIPNAIHCNLGMLRCRDLITPLYAACINENIPLHIVKLLLDNQADPKQLIRVNGYYVDLLTDIKACISLSRYYAVKTMFLEKENYP
jgi:hypothetical protein